MNTKERNYGIDLLRVAAMLMICVYHVLGRGGIMQSTDYLSVRWAASWGLEKLTLCCVDCYALVSGYVGITSRHKPASWISQWLQVAFYSLGITLLFKLLWPQTVTLQQLGRSVLPVLTNQYWYFSAYTGLFLLMPLLNHIVHTFDGKKLGVTLLTAALVMTLPTALFDTEVFGLNGGYSTMWLALLYLIGAWVRLHGKNSVKTWVWALVYLGSCFVTFAVKMVSDYMFLHRGFRVFHGLYSAFCSPMVLAGAFALLMIFSRLRVGSVKLQKTIRILAAASFGVYLIHVHPCIWDNWLLHAFVDVAKLPVVPMLLASVGISAALMALCLFIDSIRIRLFALLHLDRLAQAIGGRVEFCMKKAYTGSDA